MDASCARKRLLEVSRKREGLCRNLMSFRQAMVEGTLVERCVTCGKAGCECRKGKPHGPFLYLVQRAGGRARWSYLGKATQGPVAQAVKRRRRFCELMEALRELAEEERSCLEALAEALTVDASTLSRKRKEVAE